MTLPNLQAHCQSPTSQLYNQSFVKELAKLTHEQKDNAAKIKDGISEDKNGQLVTGGIFYCRDSGYFSVSAFNKLSCNLTGQCFDIGNKNIPPNR
jgi:hypothetical protein